MLFQTRNLIDSMMNCCHLFSSCYQIDAKYLCQKFTIFKCSCNVNYGILNFGRGNCNELDVIIFSNAVTEDTF